MYLTLDLKIYFQSVSFYDGVMKRTVWIGAHKKISEFNVALVCVLQIVIIFYTLIDTVEPRPQEMQNKIANAVPVQHDAFESSFVTKSKIRESSKNYSSQTLSFIAVYTIKIPFLFKPFSNFY